MQLEGIDIKEGVEAQVPTTAEDAGKGGGHILVVDDDILVNRLVSTTLKNVGYRVDSAENGESGWDAIQADRFDLLITDNAMPRLNGIDLLRRMRSNSVGLPAILMSADMPRNIAEIIELVSSKGALHKPFSAKDLLHKVESIISDGRILPNAPTHLEAARVRKKQLRFEVKTNIAEIAHNLLDYECKAQGSTDAKPAIFKVCDKMRNPILNLAGETGFSSILSHALVHARPEVSWLDDVKISPRGFFEGLGQAESALQPLEISRGEFILVAEILSLLFAFLGEAMTRMILQDAWMEIPLTG